MEMADVPLGPGGNRRRASGHSSAAGSQGILLQRENQRLKIFLLKAQFTGSDQEKGSLCPPLIPHLPGATKYIGSDLLAAMKASRWRGDHWSWAGEPLSWTPRQPSVPGAPTRSSQHGKGRCF